MLSKNLGKYEILKWLGGGGFGDVYLARDTLIDKIFALKIPRIREEEWEILKREAKILSELSHPNIVRFYSVDIIDKQLVMTMEYVEGKSLRTLLKSAPLPEEDIIRIIRKVLEALDYAHKKGILHRDLKPENIILDKNLKPKITDFGLAIIFQDKIISGIVGTPMYLAPEAWRGNYTPQTDIFALGCIMFEMFKGEPPFTGKNLDEIREKIRHGRYSKLKENASDRIKEIIYKAINPDPLKRFKSARDFLLHIEGKIKESAIPVFEIKMKDKEKNILEDLTDEQKDAITSEERFVLVKGGAGCGKTKVLITRAAYLMELKNIEPEEIIITTFTGRAIEEIRERLNILLSRKRYISLNIGTLHSIALQVIEVGGKRIGFDTDNLRILSASESYNIFKSIFPNLSLIEAKEIMKTISISKSNMMYPSDLLKNDSVFYVECGRMYMRYNEYLKKYNLMDYDDIIFHANIILEKNSDIRKRFSENIKHILVDEFQDLSYSQVLLLKLLREEGGFLFATGDEDQAIYGFRGASFEFIKNFEKYFKGAKIFYLTRSFRIPEEIFEAGQKLLSHNKNREEIFFIPKKKQGKSIFLYNGENEKKEAEFIANQIKLLFKEKIKPENIAILSRQFSYLKEIEKILKRENIPYNLQGKSKFFSKSLIKGAILYLNAVDSSKKTILKNSLKYFLGEEKIKSEKKRLTDLFMKHLKDKKRLTPKEIVEEFLKEIGYFSFIEKLPSDRVLEENETLEELYFLLGPYREGELKKFLNSFTLLENLEKSKEEGVFLSTIHGAKGLEFEIVFITGLSEGIFPSSRSLSSRKEIEEERRIFYVALTRATEKVFLTRSRTKNNRIIPVSRFIEEILIA